MALYVLVLTSLAHVFSSLSRVKCGRTETTVSLASSRRIVLWRPSYPRYAKCCASKGAPQAFQGSAKMRWYVARICRFRRAAFRTGAWPLEVLRNSFKDKYWKVWVYTFWRSASRDCFRICSYDWYIPSWGTTTLSCTYRLMTFARRSVICFCRFNFPSVYLTE